MSITCTDSLLANDRRQLGYQPMLLCLIAFSGGILADHTFDLPAVVSGVVVAVSLVAWLVSSTFKRLDHTTSWSVLMSTILLVGWLALGSFWHQGRWNWFGVSEIGLFADRTAKPCAIEATIIAEPRMIAPNDAEGEFEFPKNVVRTKLLVKVHRIRHNTSWKGTTGQLEIIVHTPIKRLRSGDTIRVYGRLVTIAPPSNPGQFDFRSYYRAAGRLAFVHVYHADSTQVIPRGKNGGVQVLSRLRRRLNELTWKYVDQDEAGFAAAIMLGNCEQLSSERRQRFLETGTIHLLAISGLHVGILAGSFFLLFRLGISSRRVSLVATIAFVLFYAWLVEFRPPVSRAAVLIVLYCLGKLWGEKQFSFNLIAIAGLVVLFFNPTDLFKLGPQLSFLAVATLTFGREWVFWPPTDDPVRRLIASTRPWHVRVCYWLGRQTRTATLVSTLVWIVAMPLVAYRFHLVAPIALIVNPLLLIPIAWALYSGLGVLTFGWISESAASVCGDFCRVNLSWIESMIASAQSIPGGHVWTAGPTLPALVLFYLGLFLVAMFPPSRLPFRWIFALGVFWFVICWLLPDRANSCFKRRQSIQCTFIDVGHGTSVLLELPRGRTILYDAGSFGSSDYGARNISAVLWSKRISRIDGIVISHADIDHYNAVPFLVSRFSVGQVLVSQPMGENQSPSIVSLFQTVADAGIPVCRLACGDRLLVDDRVEIDILGPPVFGTGGNDNSDSVVMCLTYHGKRLMLPGDLESYGMEFLLQRPPLNCHVVMAPHHGSKNSMPTKFLRWATPEQIVVSGGSSKIDQATLKLFSQSGRTVYRTDQHGAIQIEMSDNQVRTSHWAIDRWESIEVANVASGLVRGDVLPVDDD